MSSDVMSSGEYPGGFSSYAPKPFTDNNPERKRGGFEEEFACARLLHKGDVIFSGKSAVRHFCFLQMIKEENTKTERELVFEPVRGPNGRNKRHISFRTQGKTWNIIPGTERVDGFARVHVHHGKIDHDCFWVYTPDIGRTTQVTLWQPVSREVL